MKMTAYKLIFTDDKKAQEFYTIFGGTENKQVSLKNNTMTAKLAYNPGNVYTKKIMKKYGIQEIK